MNSYMLTDSTTDRDNANRAYREIAQSYRKIAQSYFECHRNAHIIASVLAILILVFQRYEAMSYMFAVFAVLAEAIAWWFSYWGWHHHRCCRQFLRRTLLYDAFSNTEGEYTEIADSFALYDADELEKASVEFKQNRYQRIAEFFCLPVLWSLQSKQSSREHKECFDRNKLKEVEKTLDPHRENTLSINVGTNPSSIVSDEYFDSNKPKGDERLLDHLRENAFWTGYLYYAAAKSAILLVILIFVIVFLLIAFVVVPLALPLAPKVFSVFLVFWFFDELNTVLHWRTAAESIENVYKSLLTLLKYKEFSQEKLFSVFNDYEVTTTLTPPIPAKIYESHKRIIKQLWEQEKVRYADICSHPDDFDAGTQTI
jgi:hypothetical protein